MTDMCTTPNKEYADMLDVPAKPARPYTRNSPLPQTEEQRIEQMTDLEKETNKWIESLTTLLGANKWNILLF
jgi:hypothetical protein